MTYICENCGKGCYADLGSVGLEVGLCQECWDKFCKGGKSAYEVMLEEARGHFWWMEK